MTSTIGLTVGPDRVAALHALELPQKDNLVNVAALIRGQGGSLLVVRDSYSSLGWERYHLQPPDAFARALERGTATRGACSVSLRRAPRPTFGRAWQTEATISATGTTERLSAAREP